MCIRDRYQRRVHGVEDCIVNTDSLDLNSKYCKIVAFDSALVGGGAPKKVPQKSERRRLTDEKVKEKRQKKRSMEEERKLEYNRQFIILSLIHISEPTRPLYISYAVFCLKKKNTIQYNKQIKIKT
eukprot:TRINITY_DN62868_c0_g1_i1.p2 TRINITY_DN62868_c0_g1~~TRINITY_DN62868_c0_g1_i1.p2  ORF type:complete len:126 (-),score=31.76 TRINITY_DN62868_c0_g1_i1:52-429(-)